MTCDGRYTPLPKRVLRTSGRGCGSSGGSWATPQKHDAQSPNTPENRARQDERVIAERGRAHGARNLNEEAALWPTATSTDYKGSTREGQRRGQLSGNGEQPWNREGADGLNTTASLWATPRVNEAKGSNYQIADGKVYPTLCGQAEGTVPSSRPLPATAPHGPLSSLVTRGWSRRALRRGRCSPAVVAEGLRLLRPKLNPRFTEALMGWPSDAVRSRPSATAGFRSWLRRFGAALHAISPEPEHDTEAANG